MNIKYMFTEKNETFLKFTILFQYHILPTAKMYGTGL